MVDHMPPPVVPEDAFDETRDVLAHLYDYPYLIQHPIMRRLRISHDGENSAALQKLRAMVLDAIEAMRPGRQIPASDPAWRPYLVLHHRYILGKEIAQVQEDLGLGIRQLQREQRRAIEALALILQEKADQLASDGAPAVEDALAQEVAREAAEQQLFDVSPQIGKAIESVHALAAAHGVQLVAQPGAVPVYVRGSASLFRQMVVAALSFLVRKARPGTLVVRIDYQSSTVVIRCGIEHRALEGDVGQTHDVPETLSILADAQHAVVRYEAEKSGPLLSISLAARGERHTVVIVEDNEDLLALFSRYLSQTGYEMVAITESARAYDRVLSIRPDAVVLDIMMHDVDGWELLQRIKAEPRLRSTPIIVCSVLDEEQLASSLGADAYLRKPVNPSQLLGCLAHLLSPPHSGVAGSV